MNEDKLTQNHLRIVIIFLNKTATFSKRSLSKSTGLPFTYVDYIVDSLIGRCEVKPLGYGLFIRKVQQLCLE